MYFYLMVNRQQSSSMFKKELLIANFFLQKYKKNK